MWVRFISSDPVYLVGARLGDGSSAPSLGGHSVDGSPVLGSVAAHGPAPIPSEGVGEVEVPRCGEQIQTDEGGHLGVNGRLG